MLCLHISTLLIVSLLYTNSVRHFTFIQLHLEKENWSTLHRNDQQSVDYMFDNNQNTKIRNDRFWSYLATVSIRPGG